LQDEGRRQVTVLFADLVGFTSLSERLDPEDVRDITTDCLRQISAEAVRFEGTVDKLIGDAVMILFGAPVAHEDDPARALRAALAMQRALGRFNHELEGQRGLALRLRIGVESGEVIAGPREVGGMVEYTVIGDAVNVAARLQAAAEPGAILVGETTRQRVGGVFELGDAQSLSLKGRERPVRAAVLIDEAVAGPVAGSRAELVGRDDELLALRRSVAALRTGQGGMAVVMGGPGLGKSRLIAELRAHAEGLHWARCQAYAHEQTDSYGLARSLVRALLGISSAHRDEAAGTGLRARLAALGLSDPDLGIEGSLARLLGFPRPDAEADRALDALSPREVQRRIFAAVGSLVDGLTTLQPLVLELDDLHWADPTSVDLLLNLLERAGHSRLLLCCAFRPERDVACQVLRTVGRTELGERYLEIALGPLTEAACAELATRLLRQTRDEASDRLADALPQGLWSLLERAAGTPLWLEELIRTLLERGVLSVTSTGWQLAADPTTIDLPDSLQALMVARIDRLGAARPLLQVASVIGRRFGRTVLQRLAEAPNRLDADLSLAQRADLVHELPARDEREYDFKHVLVRDAAYATLLHRRRRALHRRVAEIVEALYPDRVPEYHTILAYHYEHAQEWPRAYAHAHASAEAARDSHANREALGSYALALRAAEQAGLGAAERGRLFEGMGTVQERLGDFEAARESFEMALALAEERADDSSRVRLLGALGMLWGGHKDYQRGVELTGLAVELAGQCRDASAQADASVRLSIMYLNLLRLPEARAAMESALALYQELDDAHGQARTLDTLGVLACCDGRLGEGARYLREAQGRFEALGDRGGALSCGTMQGWPLAATGQRIEAERVVRQAIAIAQEMDAPSSEAFAWMILAEGLDPYGAFTRAEETAGRALTIARAIDHREWSLAALGPIGRVRRARGDLAGALANHQEMLAIAREVGSALWTTEALANVAFDQLVLGDLEAARLASDECIAFGGHFQRGTIDAWITRIVLLLTAGHLTDALVLARETRALIAEHRVRLPELSCLEGAVLERLGQRAEAKTAYRAALAEAREVGTAVGLWQAVEALAGCLAVDGQIEEAERLRAAAIAELDALADALSEPGLRETLANLSPLASLSPGATPPSAHLP
jgi:class 3 adenylate cyclase/tetratricopeptide (TPR) repeat protein